MWRGADLLRVCARVRVVWCGVWCVVCGVWCVVFGVCLWCVCVCDKEREGE